MSEKKQPTVGPWNANIGNNGVIWVDDASGNCICDLYHKVGGIDPLGACQLYPLGTTIVTKDNAEANARAIAALPDMIVALQKIVNDYDNQDLDHVDFRMRAAGLASEILERVGVEVPLHMQRG